MASNLLDLPPEILGTICDSLTPTEITRFGRTCRKANGFVLPSNFTLWQNAFLKCFDDPLARTGDSLSLANPRSEDSKRHRDWHTELRRRLMLFRTVQGLSSDGIQLTHDEVAEIVLDIVDTAQTDLTDKAFTSMKARERESGPRCHNLSWLASQQAGKLDRFIDDYQPSETAKAVIASLPGGRHYTRSVARHEKSHRSDAISRLHVLYSLTASEINWEAGLGEARRLTYNWHLTSDATDHGPYHLDGSGGINWQLLEAVCSTISRNVRRCASGHFSMPQTMRYSIPCRTEANPSVPQDWAGVTGGWVGTYAFLDYQDLFHYNVGYAGGPRPSLDDDPEACGDLMRLELKLDDTDKVKCDWRFQTKLPVCDSLPTLYFTGNSRGHGMPPRPLVSVRGSVSLLPGGREVRWRYLISYGGADQWQLEGVQPGGIRSAGVYGLWSHCDHEAHGPVGPFCYFPLDLVH